MEIAPDPADERLHAPSGDPNWCELIDFDFWSPRATFGGHLTVVRWPAVRAAWYWAAVVEEGSPLVTVVETDIAEPRVGWELRTHGLWADHVCEQPLEHWSVGLEAFAVALDEPDEVFGSFRGDRVPLGFDLEWEAGPGAQRVPGGYVQHADVVGEVLVGPDSYDLTGFGTRSHQWGDDVAFWRAGTRSRGRSAGGEMVEESADATPAWPEGRPPETALGDGVVAWSPARFDVPTGEVRIARLLRRDAPWTGWTDLVDRSPR